MATQPKKYLPAIYFVLWIILLFFFFSQIPKELPSLLFAVSALLVFTHLLYAGYFPFSKGVPLTILALILSFLLYACLIFLIKAIVQPLSWFYWLQVIFFLAMLFHLYCKSKISEVYFKEFCNYKLYIELCGILLSLLGVLLYTLWRIQPLALGVLTFIFILKLNFSIFIKKKLYSIYYQDPVVSGSALVTIVIIAYNEEQYIGRLLKSIQAQDYRNYEIIIVDDHSRDKTVEIAAPFASSMPLKIVQKDIRGASRSRNFGASFAKGEVILFLDADVALPPRFISVNLEAFINQKLSVAGIDFIAESSDKIDRFIVAFYRVWLKTVQYFNPRGIGFCLFVRRELHEKVLFDDTIVMSEDFDYVKRAARQGKFRIIKAIPAVVSWRRFQKESRFLLILKYMFFECYRQNIGEIRRKILPYKFGNN